MRKVVRGTRRGATRRKVDWAARCRFGLAGDWVDCRVVNAAVNGVAIELKGTVAPEAGQVTIEVLPGQALGVRVRGEARHVQRAGDNVVIIGVEFIGLTANDRVKVAKLLVKGP